MPDTAGPGSTVCHAPSDAPPGTVSSPYLPLRRLSDTLWRQDRPGIGYDTLPLHYVVGS